MITEILNEIICKVKMQYPIIVDYISSSSAYIIYYNDEYVCTLRCLVLEKEHELSIRWPTAGPKLADEIESVNYEVFPDRQVYTNRVKRFDLYDEKCFDNTVNLIISLIKELDND